MDFKNTTLRFALAGIAATLALVASNSNAVEREFTQEQLLATLRCAMVAQKHVAAFAAVKVNASRNDAVVALSQSKWPGQSPEDVRREAESIYDFALANRALNPERTADEKFAACAKERGLAASTDFNPLCRKLLPHASELMESRKSGDSKSQALKKVKASSTGLEKLDWNAITDRAYAWQRSPTEFSVSEVVKCIKGGT